MSKKVRELFKQKGLRCSDATLRLIESELKKICLRASDNALADALKTVRPAHVPKLDILLENSPESL